MHLSVFIHEKAYVESVKIGEGTRIWEFCHVLPDAIIGKKCNICAYTYIENNVIIGDNVTVKNAVSLWDKIRIEDDVFIGPHAVFTNDLNPRAGVKKSSSELLETVRKKGCTIGANATLLSDIVLGKYSFIGAGSVVTKDVPDYALMIGNPAKQVGYVCKCGAPMKLGKKCTCGRIYDNNISGVALLR